MPLTLSGSAELRRKLKDMGEVARGRVMVQALIAGGLVIQNDAKRNAPYLTGNLRRSIHIGGESMEGAVIQRTGEPVPEPEINGLQSSISIGTDVDYAARKEFGFDGTDAAGRTHHEGATPYMRPAVDNNRSEVSREIAESLRDLVNVAAR